MTQNSKINWPTLAKAFTAASFSTAFAFMAQRFLTWSALGLNTLPSSAMRFQAQVTGLLADFWGGVVGALMVTALVLIVPLFRRHIFLSFFVLTTLFIGFLCLHIPYVEFFGSMISLSHFKYLLDPQFLKSSTSSLTDMRLVNITLLSFAIFGITYFSLQKASKPLWVAPAVLVVGILCQVTKVQLNTKKVGWKTPAVLAVTSLEYAFIQLMDPRDVRVQPISQKELEVLRAFRNSEQATIKQLIEGNYLKAEEPIGLQIKNTIRERLKNNKPVTLFVMLLESIRPEESKYFTPTNSKSYTPYIDTLAQTGFSYTNAWTAGGVTRAGQEAVWCGLLTGEFTSAMRNLISLSPYCLPQVLKNNFASRSWNAWWHGGDYDFDSQGTFWKRQGVQFTTHRKDFAAHTPSTFWGVSDLALVEKFRREILQRQPQEALVSAHLFLTITNHPDWGLPSDAPSSISRTSGPQIRPNFLTTLYTDYAVKQLVSILRNTPCLKCESESIWDSSIFVVVNDHGVLVPSQQEPEGRTFGISNTLDIDAARANSRAVLIVSGGLVEKALKTNGRLGMKFEKPVSQIDIFPTLVDLVSDQPIASFGDSLFASRRRWPVMVDLGQNIYFPELTDTQTKVFKRTSLLKAEEFIVPKPSFSNFELNKTAFRAYQSLLTSGDAGRVQ